MLCTYFIRYLLCLPYKVHSRDQTRQNAAAQFIYLEHNSTSSNPLKTTEVEFLKSVVVGKAEDKDSRDH